jgi:hypothetical protein
MDCRKFQKNLEDYLEDRLDFPGRFGMERHAQQCIACGKDLAGAQRLSRMVREVERVKAPSGFEASVLNEIGKRKASGRFSGFRRFWVYNFEFPAVRKLALASSVVVALATGAFYLSAHFFHRPVPELHPAPAMAVREPVKAIQTQNPPVEVTAAVARPVHLAQQNLNRPSVKEELTKAPDAEREKIVEEMMETDYVELQMIGPDNRPVTFRLPNKTRIRDAQTPDNEYFIRNVSH